MSSLSSNRRDHQHTTVIYMTGVNYIPVYDCNIYVCVNYTPAYDCNIYDTL